LKNIGLLVTKNEEEIIEEVLSKNQKFVDTIYALDGSEDNTPKILKKFNKVKLILYEKDLNALRVDGIREYLLEEIRKKEGYNHWITLLHGDEIFYHNPLKVIQYAEKEEADGVVWYAMHFFLHSSDKKIWNEIKNLPVEKRVTWYAINETPWQEFRQFKLTENVKYNKIEHSRVRPHGIRKIFSKRPIYKHYKVYCLKQFQIYRSRWGGLRQKEIFIDKMPQYKYAIKFIKDFGKFEKGLECLK